MGLGIREEEVSILNYLCISNSDRLFDYHKFESIILDLRHNKVNMFC